MFNLINIVTCFSILSLGSVAMAADSTGTYFEPGSNRQRALFKVKRQQTVTNGVTELKSSYTGVNGEEALTEEAKLESDKLVFFKMHQKQVNRIYTVERLGESYRMTTEHEGKKEESIEKIEGVALVPPTIVPFIQSHWERIQNGETIPFRVIAVERRETVGFKLFRDPERSSAETTAVVMKPTSIFIAALVKPIVLQLDIKTKKLRTMVGRTPLKQRENGKWKDVEAELVND